MKTMPTQRQQVILKSSCLDTKLGPMIAIADAVGLYVLKFLDQCSFETEIKKLEKKFHATIVPGETNIIKSIGSEIANYFNGTNISFNTPIHFIGSPFQKAVWQELRKTPSGDTRSYLDIAKSIKAPKACRAVGSANGANQLALIIPCHRVINTNGKLGGYAGGLARKQWLLDHEKGPRLSVGLMVGKQDKC